MEEIIGIEFNDEEVNQTTQQVRELLTEINQVRQPRSDFVLKHFVVMQHDMPARQRMQVLDELEALMFSVQDMQDERELEILGILARIENENKTAADLIHIRRAERKVLQMEMAINGRTREINTLLGILKTMPEYSREQVEAEEAEYWMRRLSRQMALSQAGAGSGMGEGNLDAMLQTFAQPGQVRELNIEGTKGVIGLLLGEVK